MSPKFCELTGYSSIDTVFDDAFMKLIIHQDDHQEISSAIQVALHERQEFFAVAYRIISKNGAVHFIESQCSIVEYDEEGNAARVVGTIINIISQKYAGSERRKLTRALLAINTCNQALLHANDEIDLLRDICHIVVDIGGYRMAWVGYAEQDEAKNVRPVAQAGFEDGYLDTLMISWADEERGRGPAGTAIRTGQPCVIIDILADPRFELWRMEAKKRGFASSLSLPLKRDNQVFGAFTIYSVFPNAFNAEETTLLTSLADNLSYGITMLQTRKSREVAEEQLRLSESRYRSLFQNHHTVMLIVDPEDGKIVDANPAAVSYYGWDQSELCQMKISQINMLMEQDIISEMALAKKHKRNYFIFRHRLADGSIRDVEVYSGPITFSEKKLLYSIINDITERLQTEKALRDSERRFRSITEQVVEMVFVTDNTGRLTYASSVMEQMFGYSAHEAKGQLIAGYVVEEEILRALVIFHDTLQGCLTDQIHEFKFMKKNGSLFYGEIHMRHYQDQDTVGLIGLIRDTTIRRQSEEAKAKLEAQLQQSQKMEMVGRLAGGIAHDFNNMLSVILGHSEMGLELLDPSQLLYADFEAIRKAATRSADLTRQLLAFSRKQIVLPKILELNVVVEELLPMLQRLIGENIKLVWIPDSKLPLLKIDPSQIDQILINLVVNARDAITGNGTITLESRGISVSGSASEVSSTEEHGVGYVTLFVIDDGCGIDQNDIAHIFEPFFTTKEQGKGTGLGLSTVYGIVKQNNGTIDCHSEPGKGTTFTIHLPAYRASLKTDRMSLPEQSSDKRHQTILLVEDEPSFLNLCKLMLERNGYNVLEAGTAAEAVRIAKTYPGRIELLLTDVIMPEMNGSELSKKLFATRPDLKTLFMSGFTADVITHNTLLDTSVNFIHKPFNIKSLDKAIEKILK